MNRSIDFYHKFWIVVIISALLLIWTYSSSEFGNAPEPLQMTIREARPTDIDAVTDVAIKGWAKEKSWRWRFPYADEYPEVHLQLTRERYLDFITGAQTLVMVTEVPHTDDPKVSRIVSVAIWQLPPKNPPSSAPGEDPSTDLPPDHWDRPDANPARMKEWRTRLVQGEKEIFTDVYGHSLLHLLILVTHPEHQRRGYGTDHIRWGMEKAEREGIMVVAAALDDVVPLYKKLNFAAVGSVHLQVRGEIEFLDIIYLMHP